MERRVLGRTGVSLSPLCLGAIVDIDGAGAGWQDPALEPAARRR
ncbi:MAG TPA: hypothetical protein VFI66_01100 [Gemmatimonadales bacterium]|nr:hypothetical protein [Gemmatimonadales bacterium]